MKQKPISMPTFAHCRERTCSYDSGGRLATVKMTAGSVTQTRTFFYDGRGLLASEDHPESALTSYEYDAKGHARKRTIGNSVLTFDSTLPNAS